MLLIEDVKVRTFCFTPRERPVEPFQNAILTFRPGVERIGNIVEVTTDGGLKGICPGGNKEIVEGPLRRALVGEDPVNVERLWQKMYMGGWRKPVAKGFLIRSISVVDNALWDLLGKFIGLPVYKLLGGFRDRVPCYAAGGYYRKGWGVEELVNEMEGYVRQGYRHVKMKVGRLDFKEDIERVRVVRETVGDDVEVMLDANNAWNAYEAIKFIKEVETYRPYWLEEPVHPDDVKGSLEVKAATSVPIASGENEFTRWGSRDLIEKRAVDIIQVDPMVCGGFTEIRKIAAMASAYHIALAPHGGHIIGGHAVAAFPNGLIVESYPFWFDHAAYDALRWVGKPIKIEDGWIKMSDEPGLGLEIDEEKASKYEVKT